MTPSPLDRKTKANEAEPRWRDRLVLTRVSPITKLEFLTLGKAEPYVSHIGTPRFLSETHQGEGGLAYSYSITQGSRMEQLGVTRKPPGWGW